MPKLAIRIDMTPVPKQRPRVVAGGRRTYTPWKTVLAERQIAWEWAAVYGKTALDLWERDDPLKLTIWCFLERPPSVKRGWPTRKFDIDNLAKTCLDGLLGVAYYDDGQVTCLQVLKRYAPPNKRPGIVIVLEDDRHSVADELQQEEELEHA